MFTLFNFFYLTRASSDTIFHLRYFFEFKVLGSLVCNKSFMINKLENKSSETKQKQAYTICISDRTEFTNKHRHKMPLIVFH